MSEKPYWWPTIVDEAFFARLRDDYPEDADLSNEELHDEYADGRKYAVLWDHTGDAYDDFEPLADAFFEQQAQIERLAAIVERFAKTHDNAAILPGGCYYDIDGEEWLCMEVVLPDDGHPQVVLQSADGGATEVISAMGTLDWLYESCEAAEAAKERE